MSNDDPTPPPNAARVSPLRRALAVAFALLLVGGGLTAGATATVVVLHTLEPRLPWLSAIKEQDARTWGGILFGLVPVWIVANFIWRRRKAKTVQRGFATETDGPERA